MIWGLGQSAGIRAISTQSGGFYCAILIYISAWLRLEQRRRAWWSSTCFVTQGEHDTTPNKGEYAMKKLVLAFAAAALLTAPTYAGKACRDAKGKFTKCPTATAAAAPGVTKDAKGKCHFASGPKKGQFTKCR